MAKTIVIGGTNNAPDPDVVVLFDQKYIVRRVTRSIQRLLEKSEKNIQAAMGQEDSDKLVAALVEGIGAMLVPDGHEEPANKVLAQAWKDDHLSLDQLRELREGLQESSVDSRPT